MARVRAAVLAAGRGVRMGGRRPKAVIPLGDHEPTLAYLLRGIRRAGVDDVLIVTGFGAAEVQDYVASNFGDLDATYVFNARYASWGNFHSLRMALEQSPGFDVLAVNCDVVVHPDVFRRVIDSEGDLVLAVQRREDLDAEDMRVELAGDRVRQIGKGLKMVRSHGEFAGVSLLRDRAAALYQRMCTDLEWSADTAGYYEDVYARMLADVDARAATVGRGEYAEVDSPTDVVAAVRVVEEHWAGDRADASAEHRT